MWNKTNIEIYLENRLTKELGEDQGDSWFCKYVSARDALLENVLEEIKVKEPDLTDHGPRHVRNVLENTYKLLGESIDSISVYELYLLCLSVLFHDVGNIEGRDDHNRKVINVYNFIRKNDPSFNNERNLILLLCESHSGKTKDGSPNTLGKLPKTKQNFYGNPVDVVELSSLLRFADELAEGYQRISGYRIQKDQIHISSKIYHQYATITQIMIDRGGGRIVIQYYIDVDQNKEIDLRDILNFIYKRIVKLDEERRYNKYFSKTLKIFNSTEVSFIFMRSGIQFDIPGTDNIILDDCHVPGETTDYLDFLTNRYSALNIDNIITSIERQNNAI